MCDAETVIANIAFAAPIPQSSPDRTEAAPAANTDRGATDEPGPLPHVLGTAFTDAAEAAASLHPAFYVLLGLAMAALAAATLPARVLPVATAGAVLARHRAAVTLAGRSACSWSSSCTGSLCSNRLAYSGGFYG